MTPEKDGTMKRYERVRNIEDEIEVLVCKRCANIMKTLGIAFVRPFSEITRMFVRTGAMK